jgi:hypothetical protein|tara:strand:- start:283 stop:753 length:471 start_codon:yes stop_codon:yes gene_type:complete
MKALNNVNKTNNSQPVADKRLIRLEKLKRDLKLAMESERTQSSFITSGEIWAKIRDIELDIAKDRIHFRMTGSNKHYYANKLSQFAKLYEGKTYGSFSGARTIKRVQFTKHAIELVWESSAVSDFKRFENQQQLMNFVDGYVQAVNNHDKEKFFRV